MSEEAPTYNLAAIRDLMRAAFTAETLPRFCLERPAFRPVCYQFSPNDGLDGLIVKVVDYCSTRNLWDQFLLQLRSEYPNQYARFAARLYPGAKPPEVPCPYRGLEPFGAEHADFYFGREAMVEQLVARVGDTPFVAIVGPSGCGKSSLVRAGLVTALDAGALPGSEHWAVRIFRPEADPLWALAAPLVEELVPEDSEVDHLAGARKLAGYLRDGTVTMADVASKLAGSHLADSRLVLIADQFEELYTECRDKELRRAFVDALLAASEAGIGVVLTLRADFYGHVLASRRLGEAVDVGLVNVLPMSKEELRDAVEQPALATDRVFQAGLVERILDDVAGEPGSLPLLEFALTELWDLQTAHGLLTHEAYEAIGGVEGAIARRAEEVYAELEAKGQGETVRRVFLRLTHYGQGAEGTRRRAMLDDLVTPRTPRAEVEPAIRSLADARLLVTGREETPAAQLEGEVAQTAVVEVAHEALIQGWERLRRWLAEDRAFGLWREKLAWARQAWSGPKHDEGALLRGAPLSEAEGWLKERGDDLNAAERTFIEEGLALRAREEAARLEQQRKEAQLAAERRTTGRLRRLAVGLGISVLVAIALVALATVLWSTATQERDARATEVVVRTTAEEEAILQRDSADQSRATAEAARREANALKLAFASQSQLAQNHELALLLAIAARRAGPSLEADTAMWSWFAHPGRTLRILTGHSDQVTRVAWSPDGQFLVTASEDGTARVWEAATGTELLVLGGHEAGVARVAWSPDGERILTAGCDQFGDMFECVVSTTRVWEAATGAELFVLAGHTGYLWDAAWSPDGRLIATSGQGGTTQVWDAGSGEGLAVFAGHEDGVRDVAWSPDSQRLVTTGFDDTVRLWDLSTALSTGADSGGELAILAGHTDAVLYAAWSPDGRRVATASRDGTARLWNAEGEAGPIVLSRHTDTVRHVVWDKEGQRVVTASDDGTARVWDGNSGAELAVLSGHKAAVMDVVWDGEGQRILTASKDGTARVWDGDSGAELAVLTGHAGQLWQAAWDTEGQRIVTASSDRTARVWAAGSGAELVVLRRHKAAVVYAVWSPDGQRIVTASQDQMARVWDATTGAELVVLAGHMAGVVHATWDKEGQRIVTASQDGTARVWDAATGTELAVLAGHMGPVVHAAWDEEGQRIATAGFDGTARVWDAGSGDELALLTGHMGPVVHAAWDEEGRRAVTAGLDGTARVWNAGTGEELVALHGHTDQVVYAAWSPDDRRVVTASLDGTARVWNAETGEELVVFSEHTDGVEYAAWDEKGRRVVTASRDDTARVWDAETGVTLALLAGHKATVAHAAWSPTGQRILTASYDGMARVWDAETGNELAILTGHTGPVVQAMWDGEGRRIVTASFDGTARVYYAGFKDLVAFACERAARNMSEEERRRYVGEASDREICPGKSLPQTEP